jgi:histone H2A
MNYIYPDADFGLPRLEPTSDQEGVPEVEEEEEEEEEGAAADVIPEAEAEAEAEAEEAEAEAEEGVSEPAVELEEEEVSEPAVEPEEEEVSEPAAEPARPVIQSRKKKNPASVGVSRGTRAGLQFPVGRIHRKLRTGTGTGKRISANAPVFLAAVLEGLAVEVLVQAGEETVRDGRQRITPRDINLALRMDDDLDRLSHRAFVVGGGPRPLLRCVAGDTFLSKKDRRRARRAARETTSPA